MNDTKRIPETAKSLFNVLNQFSPQAFSFSNDSVMESWEEKAESAEEIPESLLQVFSLLWQLFSFTRSKLEIPESTWLSSSDRL